MIWTSNNRHHHIVVVSHLHLKHFGALWALFWCPFARGDPFLPFFLKMPFWCGALWCLFTKWTPLSKAVPQGHCILSQCCHLTNKLKFRWPGLYVYPFSHESGNTHTHDVKTITPIADVGCKNMSDWMISVHRNGLYPQWVLVRCQCSIKRWLDTT